MKPREYRLRARAAVAIVVALVVAYVAQSQLLRNGNLLDGGLLILLAALLAGYALRQVKAEEDPPLSRMQILVIMTAIVFAGAVVRFWDLASIPQGVWFDEAQNGLVAGRILTEPGYKPIYISDLTQLPALFFYYLAGWIGAVGSNILAVRLASASLGLLTIPGLFLLGRELFSQRVGLIAAFLLSQSRWHVNFSRFGMSGIAAPFCLVFALFFLARGIRTGRQRDFVLAGATFGVGLNTYLAFNVVPVLVAIWILHLFASSRLTFVQKYWRQIAAGAVVMLVVVAPLAVFALGDRQAFLERTQTASLFTGKTADEARQALISNIVKHAEMFNFRGDSNGRHNLAGSPELDDITGTLFLLGIILAISRARQPRFSLLLLWLVFLTLPGILSLDFEAPQSYRSIGVIPATSLLAALPLAYGWRVIWGWLGAISVRALDVAATLVVIVAGYSNFDTYWFHQIWDNASWAEFSTQATLIAREANRLGPSYTVYMDPVFVGVPTISFVAPQLTRQLPFDPATALPFRLSGNVVVFGSDQNLSWINAVHQDYPDGSYRSFAASPSAGSILYEAIVTDQEVAAVQGLTADYATGTAQDAKAAFRRVDKSIDFRWSQSTPVPPPFVVTWQGTLKTPTFGDYVFRLDGPPDAQVILDEAALVGGGQQKSIRLAQGTHSLTIKAAIASPADLRLFWQAPGGLLQVVPPDALFSSPVKNRGLEASFYPNAAWSGQPSIQRIDPDVSKHYHLLPLPQPFTVEWVGKVDAPTAGLYRFGTQSIDASWLSIDGRQLVDNSRGPDQYVEGAISLTDGLHDIKIRFLDENGHSFIDVYWQPPGGPKTLLPGERVFPPMAAYPERAGPLRSATTPFVAANATMAAPSALPGADNAQPAVNAPEPSAGQAIGTLPVSSVPLKATLGEKGTGPGQSTDARGVGVDASGNVAIVDAGNKRVNLFGVDGKLVRTIGSAGTGDGQFTDPVAAAFDPAGNLLVLDAETAWIERFNPAGQFTGKFGGPAAAFYHPRGLFVDSVGNTYIADTGTGRIAVYNTNGEFVKNLGEHGTKVGQLQEPAGVAVAADGSIYVTDPTAHRLDRYDATFQLVTSWDIAPTDTVNGAHVALGPDGSVYVSDPANHRVIHLDPGGQPVDQLGAAGQMARPVGVSVDQKGTVYVADSDLDQVFVFGQ